MAVRNARVSKTCTVCDEGFTVPFCRAETAKVCSQKCRDAANAARYAEERITIECKYCGVKFDSPKCHAHKRVFCSVDCHSNAERGVIKSPLADGNTVAHTGGWILERWKFHPLAVSGYILQHRLVIERWLRGNYPSHPFLVEINGEKYLRKDVVVHHMNSDRQDNRRSNLLPCSKGVHTSIHNLQRYNPKSQWDELVSGFLSQEDNPMPVSVNF